MLIGTFSCATEVSPLGWKAEKKIRLIKIIRTETGDCQQVMGSNDRLAEQGGRFKVVLTKGSHYDYVINLITSAAGFIRLLERT